MDNKEAYNLSKKLKDVRNKCFTLSHYDLYGYHHMVDTSPKGFGCGYAIHMKKNAFQEEELSKLKNELNAMKILIKEIEGKLDEEERRISSKEITD